MPINMNYSRSALPLNEVFQLMCARRGVTFVKAESIAMSMICTFGLTDGTELLPAAGNVFYYIDCMKFFVRIALVTGSMMFRFSNLGGGSAGSLSEYFLSPLTSGAFNDINVGFETNSMVYLQNTATAGTVFITGTVFKITMV